MNNHVVTIHLTVKEAAEIIGLMSESDYRFGTNHAKLIDKIMNQIRGE